LDLEFHPSPDPARPGLLVRDPFRYSEVTLIIPPLLLRGMTLLDGAHSMEDMHALMVPMVGLSKVDGIVKDLLDGLSEAGFLNDDAFVRIRAGREQAFASAAIRQAAHAGGGYPVDAVELQRTLRAWMARAPAINALDDIVAIAAPHASPHAAVPTYAAAFDALPSSPSGVADKTFVVLGTSHYGAPGSFGLTHKPFETPLGTATTDTALVNALAAAAPAAFTLDDYCQSIEHSIEFQVVFLQHRFGPNVRILPLLCGPFVNARPEDNANVARALGALGDLQAKHSDGLLWVLGVDMAHIGPRYGDQSAARANDDHMTRVAERDHERMRRINGADAAGFWDLVGGAGRDDLKWCGAAPLYTFLRAVPDTRGQMLHYDQWNIDDTSVVSFAALSFSRGS
jgi:AmmeMemoRadiSam system protein B